MGPCTVLTTTAIGHHKPPRLDTQKSLYLAREKQRRRMPGVEKKSPRRRGTTAEFSLVLNRLAVDGGLRLRKKSVLLS